MRSFIAAVALTATLAAPTLAEEESFRRHAYDGSFEDAGFSVQNAIVNQGLVIDYVSHVGAMLARTKADVGGEKDLFEQADVYLFCSAVVSRKAMEADPMNIAHCPYGIFVIEDESGVSIGHRAYPEGPMQEVEALLDKIVQEAVEGF